MATNEAPGATWFFAFQVRRGDDGARARGQVDRRGAPPKPSREKVLTTWKPWGMEEETGSSPKQKLIFEFVVFCFVAFLMS